MRILVTNDDGIAAPGLETLEEIARALAAKISGDHEIWVVAPETNHSGAGHSLSLHDPIRMREVAPRRYEVSGTPTDCVIMAVRHILKDKRPDLVLSGVNRGQNMAEDVTYSGTIAAAFEGTLLGIRSIALSQAFTSSLQKSPRYETARHHAPDVILKLIREPWPEGILMNLNFPDREPDKVEGLKVTVQGRRDQNLFGVAEREDPYGNKYYWLGYERRRFHPAPGTDLDAVFSGFISVTPLSMNLTARELMSGLEKRLQD